MSMQGQTTHPGDRQVAATTLPLIGTLHMATVILQQGGHNLWTVGQHLD